MKRKHPPTISDDDDGEDYEQEPEQGDDEVDEEEEEENGRTDPGEETDMAAYGGHRRYPTRSKRTQRANGSNGIIGRAMPRRSERKKRREHYGGHSPSTPTKTMQIQRLPPNPVLDTRRQSSRPRHHRHRKLDHHCSSSSTTGSSTSSSSGDERRGNSNGRGGGGGGGKHSRRKSKRMEEKFEQRKLKSLMKGRKELMPINITEKEAEGSVLNIVRERVRRMNSSSCADIDPMSMDQSVGFDQVGGLSRHIQQLKEMCLFPMLYPHVFDHFAIQPPKGVLFYGPPGTGKTLIARALANECGRATAGDNETRRHRVAFFMRKGADCLSKWVGESERQLRLLFDQAYRMRPSIIFFDEIDGLAPVRSSRQDQIHSSIVSTLLALMDGIDARGEVIVIGATNRLDTIDPALRRPGRFDRELRFDLPDASTRLQILHIHTRSWPAENRVPAKLLQWLAEQSSGYCGADLKALCTEAVLIAMRERYPHMYLSAEKLLLEPSQIHVERQHFEAALRQIVPASRRDGVLFTSALSNRHSAATLIQPIVEQLLEGRVPAGYQRKAGQNEGDNIGELERVVMALAPSTVVPAARVLLNGSGRFGQGTHFLPALLARLDHLPVFLVSSERVFSGGIGGPPEEQIAQSMRQALRATAQGTPVVLSMPDMDLLEQTLPVAAWKMLISSLNVFSGSTSALVLAAVQSDYEELSADMKQSFRPQQAFPIGTPKRKAMRAFFDSVMLEQARQQPFQFRAENYPEPPRAPADDPRPVRRMGKAECLELEKMYTQMLRQFRIFLRDLLRQLVRDQRFKCFHLPVDPKDVEDYYAIVQRPMCLSQMMANIDADKYHTAEAFLDDLRLIRDNAIEYNPDKEMEDITIKHTGKWLVEMAEAMIDMEMDDDFPAKLEEARLLVEEGKRSLAQEGNGTALEKRQQDSTTTVGKKYVNFASNGTHPRLTNGHGPTTRLVAKEEPEEEEAEEEDDDDEEFTPNGGMAAASSSCTRPSRSAPSTSSSSAAALLLKKRAQSMGTAAAAMTTARKRGRKPRQASNGNRASSPSKQLANGTGKSSPPSIFVLDETALRAIGEQAADKACSNFWGIQDVENLGAELELIISKYSQQWDRSGLPQELRQCIDDFQL